MLNFDVRTAFLIFALMLLVMPLISWATLGKSDKTPLVLWSFGGLMLGAGMVIVSMRGHVPDWFSYGFANYLLALGLVTRIQSLKVLLESPLRKNIVVLLPILAIFGFEFIRVYLGDVRLRLEYMFTIYMVLFAYTAIIAWKLHEKQNLQSAAWISVSHAIIGIAIFIRCIEIFTDAQSAGGVEGTFANLIIAIIGILFAVISNLAYAGMQIEKQGIQLELGQREYETMLETTRDGFYEIDSKGRYQDVNDVYCRMLGYTKNELLKKSIKDIQIESTNDGEQHKATQSTELSRYEAQHIRSNGALLDVEISISKFDPSTGTSLVFARDISDRKATQLDLERKIVQRTTELFNARAIAESASNIKTRFMNNMSHEMRTPLGIISGFAEVGKKEAAQQSADQFGSYFDTILNAGNNLRQLVDSILDIQTDDAQTNYYGSALVAVKPEELAAESIVAMEHRAKEKQQTLLIENISGIDSFKGNGLRLRQVLEALISNAIKFSPEHTKILLRIEAKTCKFENHPEVEGISFQVIDEGCGIPDHEMNAIFEPFFEGSRTTSKAGGVGLGLARCRKIIRQYYGTITVQNRPKRGAIFEVVIPIANSA